MLGKRIITGLVLIGMVVGLLWWNNAYVIAGALGVVGLLCTWEWHTMLVKERVVDRVILLVCMGWLLYVIAAAKTSLLLPTCLGLLWLPATWVLFTAKPMETSSQRLLGWWSALIYIGIPFGMSMILIKRPDLLAMLCLVVFLGDTGAYSMLPW